MDVDNITLLGVSSESDDQILINLYGTSWEVYTFKEKKNNCQNLTELCTEIG